MCSCSRAWPSPENPAERERRGKSLVGQGTSEGGSECGPGCRSKQHGRAEKILLWVHPIGVGGMRSMRDVSTRSASCEGSQVAAQV